MTKFKMTIICLSFLSAGYGVGYYMAKKQLVNQYREDLDEAKAFYRKKYEKVEEEYDEPDGEPPEYDEDDEDEYEPTDEDIQKNEQMLNKEGYLKDGRRIVNYDKYYKPELNNLAHNLAGVPPTPQFEAYDPEYGEEEEEPTEEEEEEAELILGAEEAAKQRSSSHLDDMPYLIDYDEFADGVDGYEKQDLYYYVEDGRVCEDDDKLVEKWENVVGIDFENALLAYNNTWVRNDQLHMLYEIHKINRSYEKDVLGVLETPRERDYRLMARKKAGMDD